MTMDQNEKLTPEEKRLLKDEIHEAWEEFPSEIQDLIMEVKQQKLKVLYMLQDWAKNHDHETMLDLISRKIACKEAKMKQMKQHESTDGNESDETDEMHESTDENESEEADERSESTDENESDEMHDSHELHKGE